MQTMWPGLAVPTVLAPMGEAWLVTSRAKSLWVLLSDIPRVVTQVTLPPTTRSLQLWAPDASLWYSIDTIPGPIPPPLPDLIVPAEAFAVGAVLLPQLLQVVTLPTDTLTHVLYLLPQTADTTVQITAFVETL
jgi:hypothetical protein